MVLKQKETISKIEIQEVEVLFKNKVEYRDYLRILCIVPLIQVSKIPKASTTIYKWATLVLLAVMTMQTITFHLLQTSIMLWRQRWNILQDRKLNSQLMNYNRFLTQQTSSNGDSLKKMTNISKNCKTTSKQKSTSLLKQAKTISRLLPRDHLDKTSPMIL